MKTAIAVLNYNGAELLKECLPSIIEAAGMARVPVRVIVLDNLSTDNSLKVLSSCFPEVEVVEAKANDFLISYNDLFSDMDEDIVIPLNNDIKVDPGFIDPLVEHFSNEDVFFVAPKILDFNGKFNGGRSRIKMKWGLLKVEVDHENSDVPGFTRTIAGGAFRRKKYMELGSMDPIFLPGYWEDTDICFKGLKSGLKGIYEPKSIIYHKEHASFSQKYSFNKKMAIVDRNMFIFFWKNISDPLLWCEHIVFLLPRLLVSVLTGKAHLAAGFFAALKKVPEIRSKRLTREKGLIVDDLELIDRVSFIRSRV